MSSAGAASRLLLFDIDGTLMVSRGSGLRAMRAAVRQVLAIDTPEVAIQPHGKTDPVLFEELATAYGVPFTQLTQVMQELHSVYATHLEIGLRDRSILEVKPGVPELLGMLQERGDVRLGLVTGNLQRTAWLKLEAAGLASYFVTGGFGSDAREREGLVEQALRRFAAAGVSCGRDRIWVIGDTPEDVRSGRHHGTRTLAVATGSHDLASLRRAEADVVLADLSDVAHVVDVFCGAG